MIKVIAFDLVGVLVFENDYPLNEIEAKIERLFGPNKSDEQFINNVKENILNTSDNEIVHITRNIIDHIYNVKISTEDLTTFKNKYTDIKFVVATNHVSFVEDFILNNFNNIFDKIYISSKINEIKPENNFFNKILDDLNVMPQEVLFLDDSIKNIQGANACNLKTIHVTKEINILNEIEKNI